MVCRYRAVRRHHRLWPQDAAHLLEKAGHAGGQGDACQGGCQPSVGRRHHHHHLFFFFILVLLCFDSNLISGLYVVLS